jgi:uncharacterized protein (AIM24 family)
MTTLFETTLKWLLQKLGALVVILAILLAFGWVNEERKRLAQEQAAITTQATVIAGLRTDLAKIDAEIAQREVAWNARAASIKAAMEAELDAIEARLEQSKQQWSGALAKFADLEQQATQARRRADDSRRRLDALERESRWWDLLLDREKYARLERARAEHAALDGVAKAWEKGRDKVAPRFSRSPLASLEAERDSKSREIAATLAAVSPDVLQLRESRSRKEQEIVALQLSTRSLQERVSQDPTRRLLVRVGALLPTALAILVFGVILLPLLIKAFLYVVVAPLAERLPAIRIIPDDRAPAIPESPRSAVSIAFEVASSEEILIHSDFLQSSSRPAQKRTQWFLNPSIPFSSIASGMAVLTRIRSDGEAATRVVVSSQNDAFGEIGVVELPHGAAMVVQPRSLAGIVKPRDSAVRITRHWRLFEPHAWLTFQLRYLVFHGPCKLIVKGCRGVRTETPDPGRPRMINQSATLGFSANLEYKNTRCETFVSYLRGKEDLFNDLFAGGPGRFVYEEMPAGGRKTGVTGRGIEGIVDAFLKAFGI